MNTIQTNSNYVVFKKSLSIHSEDRDIYQWPDPTNFEVISPVDYKNVVSLRLNDIEIPSSYYVFSNINQNTKLTFSVNGMMFSIIIMSGTYTYAELTNELTTILNQTVSAHIHSTYTHFNVTYNPVNMKLLFVNDKDNFQFDFSKAEIYECDTKITCYDNYTNWGLGSYLGFDKKVYTSTLVGTLYTIEPEYTLNLYGDNYIYMELTYYNNIDEVMPYAYKSNASIQPKVGGKHNSAFAKIPLFPQKMVSFSSRETYLSNIFFSDPPLERIQKFKIKLRHHDGRPVNFNNCNYTFTIEITMLKPDTIKPFVKVNSSNYHL
jgi:hypothetical protein